MANTLSKVNILTGNIVQDYHVTQSIDAFTGTEAYDISLSGSFNMTGSINGEPEIINPLTASYAITASYALNSNTLTSGFVTSVNGVLPSPGGNVSVALSSTITGNSSSLVVSSSGANTGSLTPGTLWVISGDANPDNNGDAFIYTTSSVTGEGQWLVISPLDVPAADARYILKNGNDSHTGSLSITGSLNMTGSITGKSGVINNLTASYAITASYVAGDINGFGVSPLTVLVATTSPLPNSPVYDNGSSGVGAFLSGSSNNSIGNIDGVSVTVNDRILVKDQILLRHNGVYEITQTGSISAPYILTRTTDSDQTSEFNPQIVIPSTGSYSGLIFAQKTESPIVGTNGITYSQVGTDIYVTQTTTGTQAANQIPWWTGTSKQLSQGKSNLTFNSTTNTLIFTTGSTSMLYVGSSTLPYTSGTNYLRAFVRYASSGVNALTSGTTLALENNTTNYMALLAPNAATSGIYMGSPSDTFGASIRWGYSLGSLLISTQQVGHNIEFLIGNKNLPSVKIEPITTNLADPNAYLILTGSIVISPTNPLPTVINGSIAFSSSGDFYFGSGSAWKKLTL